MRCWDTVASIVAACVLAASHPVRAADELPTAKFEIKEDAPRIGTNLRRKAVTSSDIPINRRYGELTDAQKDLIKSRYEIMRPTDEPPYPIDGLMPVFNAVYKVEQKVLARGELVIFVDVDAAGKALSASVIKSPDPELTRAVAGVLMLTEYKPAVCKGKPCAMGFPFRMTFNVGR